MMRLLMILPLILSLAAPALADGKKLLFVSDKDYPPISFSEAGTAKGLWVDFAAAVAQRLGAPFSVGVEDWRQAQEDVQLGKADVLYSISFDEQRAKLYELSLPVSRRQFTFFSKGKQGLQALNDLRGATVGVTKGGLPRQLIGAMPEVSLTLFDTYEDAFTALENGTIEVFAADRWVGAYILSRGRWRGVTTALEDFASLDAGFAVQKGNTALRDKLNSAIESLKKDGTFAAITSRWSQNAVLYITSEQLLLMIAVFLGLLLVLSAGWITLLLRGRRKTRKAENFSQQLMFALDQAKWGVAITNQAGTAPVYLNKEFARMHGYEVPELLGRPWAEMLDEDYRPQYLNAIKATADQGTFTAEMGRVRKDGTKFTAISTATTFTDRNGKRSGVVVNLLDISERKKAEANALRSQRLESVGTLAAGIAHDFNNILGSLRGQVELATIFLEAQQPAKAKEGLAKTNKLFDRAKVLTSRLVTFTKGGVPVRSVASLGSYLKDWVELALVGCDMTAKIEIAGDLWNCDCDTDQIGQVVHNLVVNARQASSGQGEVAVRARNVPAEGRLIAIEVEDHGVGIPAEVVDRVFDPFFSTRQAGSGLGLSVSHSIVKQHSGWIEVASEVGKGSTFTVYLPGCDAAADERAQGACPDIHLSGAAVVMDDEEGMRSSLGELLQLLGLDVHLAADGGEALLIRKALLAEGKPVVLYVLDLTVPGRMGGLETADDLRRDGDTGAVLFMSGYSEDVLRLTAGHFPGAGWLPKPFTKADLCTALGKLEGLAAAAR
jgi:PAS domain S-box-containing protein